MSATRCATSVVLLYHRLGRPRFPSLVPGQYVAPQLFRWQLDYLSTRGWQPVSVREMLQRRLASTSEERREFSITFDDGYFSVYQHAYGALCRRHMAATVYVVADAVGGSNVWDQAAGDRQEPMMSAHHLRELCQAGFGIGSHTCTHPRLTQVGPEQLQRELADSKHKLEDMIGQEVISLSYPYGDYDSRVVAAAEAAGYQEAVTTHIGTVAATTRRMEVPRVNVRWNAIGPLLMRKIGRARRSSARTAWAS